MTVITLVLAALATARLTRLVTTDRITETPRHWTLRRLNPEGMAAYLITCDWCVSVYTGSAAATGWALWGDHRWFTAVCAAFAFSYVAGYLASRESE